MWVRFKRPYLWTPKNDRRWSIQYGANERHNVTRACAAAAIEAGAAVRARSPRNESAGDGDQDDGPRAPGAPDGAASSGR
jgi:hypothetical protein